MVRRCDSVLYALIIKLFTESSSRASEYLRGRCSLCFGDMRPGLLDDTEYVEGTLSKKCTNHQVSLGLIVCLDACFTQKRMKESGKKGEGSRIEVFHPDSSFIPAVEVEDMEEHMSTIRPQHSTTAVEDDPNLPDKKIGNMRVPQSTLKQCGESFLAADERRMKASTTFYADTGCMAMLCRHDNVLWVVNMTSAGEKQHYALALMRRLFSEIPKHIKVGLMYDIGCQMHASCEKWGFLAEFRDRMEWAISVFHAGGHEWACQVVYHPRKRKGFGRSDGEGCEHFWWKLSRLIPNLRVQGFYSRLYTLDSQIGMIVAENKKSLGSWLVRKWKSALDQYTKTESEWRELVGDGTISEAEVFSEWEGQVTAQTVPLRRQSARIAKKVVMDIIALEDREEALNEEIEDLEEGLHNNDGDVEELTVQMEVLRKELGRVILAVQRKKRGLSVGDRADWRRLRDNKFLALRMNTLAVKQRLRDRLRMRRFEIDALKRHESKQKTNSHKLTKNAQAHITRREPTIKKLLKKYNGMVEKLEDMIKSKKGVPRNAVAPVTINSDELWDLDVDSPIWNDVGLDNEDNEEIPKWLGDEKMRAAIRNRIEGERCVEEAKRIKREIQALQEWCKEEYVVLETARLMPWEEG